MTDLQRHTHETIHYVLQGEGHSEIGPRVVTWRTGSFVYTPVWVWHRHYNCGATGVKMLTIESSRLTDALALGRRESAGLVSPTPECIAMRREEASLQVFSLIVRMIFPTFKADSIRR